jgi:hypothetical protein
MRVIKGGTDMSFILGLLIGMLAAILVFGLLVYWLCSRENSMAVAKFINGIAQALAHRKPVSDRATSDAEADSMRDGFLTRNSP